MIIQSLRAGLAACLCARGHPRGRPDLARQADPHRGARSAGRQHRCDRAHPGRCDAARPRPADHRRQQARRPGDARRQRDAGGAARRLHRDGHPERRRVRGSAPDQAALRPVQGHQADRGARAQRAVVRWRTAAASQDAQGRDLVREGQPRQGQLRVVQHRHGVAHAGRRAQRAGRARHAARGLQGRAPGAAGRDGWACAADVRRPRNLGADGQGRQGQGLRGHLGRSACRRCPTCRPSPSRASPP